MSKKVQNSKETRIAKGFAGFFLSELVQPFSAQANENVGTFVGTILLGFSLLFTYEERLVWH